MAGPHWRFFRHDLGDGEHVEIMISDRMVAALTSDEIGSRDTPPPNGTIDI